MRCFKWPAMLIFGLSAFWQVGLFAAELSHVQVQQCDRSGKLCLSAQAEQGAISHFDSLIVIKNPEVTEFEHGRVVSKKKASSLLVNFSTREIVVTLIEEKRIIESVLSLDSFNKRIYRTRL